MEISKFFHTQHTFNTKKCVENTAVFQHTNLVRKFMITKDYLYAEICRQAEKKRLELRRRNEDEMSRKTLEKRRVQQSAEQQLNTKQKNTENQTFKQSIESFSCSSEDFPVHEQPSELISQISMADEPSDDRLNSPIKMDQPIYEAESSSSFLEDAQDIQDQLCEKFQPRPVFNEMTEEMTFHGRSDGMLTIDINVSTIKRQECDNSAPEKSVPDNPVPENSLLENSVTNNFGPKNSEPNNSKTEITVLDNPMPDTLEFIPTPRPRSENESENESEPQIQVMVPELERNTLSQLPTSLGVIPGLLQTSSKSQEPTPGLVEYDNTQITRSQHSFFDKNTFVSDTFTSVRSVEFWKTQSKNEETQVVKLVEDETVRTVLAQLQSQLSPIREATHESSENNTDIVNTLSPTDPLSPICTFSAYRVSHLK